MKIQELEKASKIFESIKVIDEEIIEIEKLAMRLASEDMEVTLKIEFPNEYKLGHDCEPIVNECEKPFSFIGHWRHRAYRMHEQVSTQFVKQNLSVRAIMEVLGVLLKEKQAHRNYLLSSLERLGVK